MLTAYLVCLALGGLLVGLSAFGGLAKDVEGLEKPDLEAADLPVAGDLAVAGRASRRWRPLTSVRFWTFGACFFGLTGTALSELTPWGPAAVLCAASGAGLLAGTGAAWVLHRLRTPVGAVESADALVGEVGPLAYPLAHGETSKMQLRDRALLVTLASGERGPLPAGAEVVVLSLSGGLASVALADVAVRDGASAARMTPDTHEEHHEA